MSERTYDGEEVRRIFADAAEAEVEAASPPPTSLTRPAEGSAGMTLAELQEIGAEVGLSPALVARAAGALDRPEPVGPSMYKMGVPVQVKYQESLPGSLSEEAWDRLVVEMREVFQATGTTSREGSLRQWRNGNLQVLVEPTEEGWRIRMQTTSTNILGQVSAGVAVAVSGALFTSAAFFIPDDFELVLGLSLALLLGGLALFFGAWKAGPEWAETRAEQMRHLAARARELASEESVEADRIEAPRDVDESAAPG